MSGSLVTILIGLLFFGMGAVLMYLDFSDRIARIEKAQSVLFDTAQVHSRAVQSLMKYNLNEHAGAKDE